MFFSIIVVSYNSGDELLNTLMSIKNQSNKDYEIIVKDACSTDGSVNRILEEHELDGIRDRIRIVIEADQGIYDGMNHALDLVHGKYIIFLNCGDYLQDENTLELIQKNIEQSGGLSTIYYGNQYNRTAKAFVHANPHIDGFACFRHIPCHQACVYEKSLFSERKYDIKYRVRADYEHFLWCFYVKSVQPYFMDMTVCSYEGGGFSETAKGRKISDIEHVEITEKYMSQKEIKSYRLKLLLTLAPLRKKVAENPVTAKLYQAMKSRIYGK